VIDTWLVPLCKAYRISKVTGDAWAGELARLPIKKAGIAYELAEKHTSQLYADPFLGLLNAGRIDLPRNDRLINQICSLEYSALRSGRDQISHPTHGRDDCANSVAGAVDLAYGRSSYNINVWDPNFRDLDLPPLEPEPPREPPGAGGDWWRGQQRAPPTSSADDRLRSLYNAIDMAAKTGFYK
jgi:hypothetical protein